MRMCIANNVDPDQTLHSTASDLDLQCFPMSSLWAARHESANGLRRRNTLGGFSIIIYKGDNHL